MINYQLAATFAFVALGANLLGGILLLLLNAGSRSIRWYLPFHFAVTLWLFADGVWLLWPSPTIESTHMFAVVLMPVLFLTFAMMEKRERPAWLGALPLLVIAPVYTAAMSGLYDSAPFWQNALTWAIMGAGWFGGSLLLWLNERGHKPAAHQRLRIRKKVVLLALVLVAPVSVIGAMILEGPAFIVYGMPVVAMIVMLLIFYGVTRMQLYDIEVRVHRSGDIAAEGAQAERLAVLGELAATIAHEVRNPLTGVRSLAQRIAFDDVPADKRRRYGEIILEETGRVERLVSNLLELSRRSPKPAANGTGTTALDTLFEDLALLVAARAERARVGVVTDAHQLTVAAPREPLAQVLLNLLLNAIDHSPPNSSVSLTAQPVDDRVIITVRDHGTGIPAADADRIFDPFYTTGAQGTGLGLSVVRHLAREHDWRIDATNAHDGGALFSLSVCAS